MLVEIEVSADFEKRLDNQWMVEREINADRWSWQWKDNDRLAQLERENAALSHGYLNPAVVPMADAEELAAVVGVALENVELHHRASFSCTTEDQVKAAREAIADFRVRHPKP